MTQPAPQQQQPPLLLRRIGPLPVWLWFIVLVLALAAIIWWRRRRAAQTEDSGSSSSTTITPGPGGVLTYDQPQLIPVFPSDFTITLLRPEPDQDDTLPPPAEPPPPPPATEPPPPKEPVPPPNTSGPTIPKERVPQYEGATITVKKYTEPNPHMESTLWGIWELYSKISTFFRTTAKTWQEIWNHPANADLRAKRGAPENIREGDKIFVPGYYL